MPGPNGTPEAADASAPSRRSRAPRRAAVLTSPCLPAGAPGHPHVPPVAALDFVDPRLDDWNVPPSVSRSNRRLPFRRVRASELPSASAPRADGEPLVCITFDDGHANFIDAARRFSRATAFQPRLRGHELRGERGADAVRSWAQRPALGPGRRVAARRLGRARARARERARDHRLTSPWPPRRAVATRLRSPTRRRSCEILLRRLGPRRRRSTRTPTEAAAWAT